MTFAPGEEWFEHLRRVGADLPEVPGASARVELGSSESRTAASPHHVVIHDGRVTAAGPGLLDEADLSVLLAGDDLSELWRAGLDLGVAFMQGRAKVAGASSALIAVLPVLRSAAWSELLAAAPTAAD